MSRLHRTFKRGYANSSDLTFERGSFKSESSLDAFFSGKTLLKKKKKTLFLKKGGLHVFFGKRGFPLKKASRLLSLLKDPLSKVRSEEDMQIPTEFADKEGSNCS